jgi:indole-3-glycerol phosphate synthase
LDILRKIMAERREDVARDRERVPEDALREAAAGRVHHSLADRLRGPGTHVIAEMKKASPSAGLLRPSYDPAGLARVYQGNGAAAISVLTEPRHFLGDGLHVRQVRAEVDLPILRKDFMCDAYQVAEAAAWGADVILLIVAALGDGELHALHGAARELGLDVLAESHTEDELRRALELPGAIVGVNSRDLKTLKTDLATARRLAGLVPPDRLSVAESGISSRAEIEDLEARGYRGFLIGEALMKQDDPASRLAEFCGRA